MPRLLKTICITIGAAIVAVFVAGWTAYSVVQGTAEARARAAVERHERRDLRHSHPCLHEDLREIKTGVKALNRKLDRHLIQSTPRP